MKTARTLLLILSGVFLLCTKQLFAQSSCIVTISTIKGCVPHPVQFTVSVSGNTSPVKSYLWDFGDNSTGNQKDISHVYTARGTYKPKVTVVFDDGSSCTQTVKDPLVVYANPKADMNVKNNETIILCNKGDKYCFLDKTLAGTDGAPAASWIWSFGDGSISTEKNPCYAFSDSGTYVMAMEVLDTNGCKNLIQRKIHVRFATQMGAAPQPKFVTNTRYSCKNGNISAKVIFTNTTDTVGKNLTKFTWDFGDGTTISCDLTDTSCLKKWLTQERTFTQAGKFTTTLTVENKFGCKRTYKTDSSIIIQHYNLKINILPDPNTCHAIDTIINFYATPHPRASYYIWNFGDSLNTDVGRSASSGHIYKQPGTYTIRFRTKILDCIYDTILCQKVVLNGPIAKIMPEKAYYKPWDSIPKGGSYLIPETDYRYYFDTACYAQNPVPYYRYKTQKIVNGDTTFTLCKAPVVGYKTDTTYDCYKKPIVKNKPVLKKQVKSVKDKTITTWEKGYWFVGDDFPQAPVYSDTPFVNDPLQMDDTSIFACAVPHLIKYTNFSIKYRGYDAVDNFPLRHKETCINPFYPFASDSLKYEWNFREGTTGTVSTDANPDPLSRISTERLPAHLYTEEGCYWTKLTVTDLLTGCKSIDSMPVVLQKPDAGWDKKFGNEMTWKKQNEIGAGKDRRGMMLIGPPCTGNLQSINIQETLPTCYKRQFALIVDSAAVSERAVCDTNKVFHTFYTKDEVEKKMKYQYKFQAGDTGWKTMGLVIANSHDCVDTVWYHNYKYIHMLFPKVEVSKKNICVGDSVKIFMQKPDQPGAKLAYVKYIIEGKIYDTVAVLKTDTFPYIVNLKNGLDEIITSTAHNKEWGIDDQNYFNGLYDTLVKKIDVEGHVTLISYFVSRFGCIDSAKTEFTVGHSSDFWTPKTTACTSDTILFNDVISYFLPFSQNPTGYDPTRYWPDPMAARKGRQPALPETIRWDFDGDGIIDDSTTTPKFRYTKPGTYTVRMYTTDSLGCEKMVEKKDYIKVIGVQAFFSVSPPIVRYCAPHFYKFNDSSYVLQGPGGKVQIYSWTWDFGDGTPPLTITDKSKKDAAHLYLENGIYTVTLTAKTSPGTSPNGKGCYETYSQTINMIGPRADFEPVGKLDGCVPFTATFRDKSITTSKARVWKLGNGTEKSTSDEETVQMTYTRPGVYCPEMILTEEIRDLKDSLLYCTDSFPAPKCKYKVIVYAINWLNIVSGDTVLCAGEDEGIFYGFPDTGYTSFTMNFGNGHSETQTKPVFKYTYPDTGHFTLTLTGENGRCPDTATFNVRVIDIMSDFYLDTLRNDTPTFSFVNTSRNGIKYKWEFDDGTPPVWVDNANSITHEFAKSGKVNVCLTAYNEKGCFRKVCKELEIITDIWIPNVFTPNGLDADNENFRIRIKGERRYDLTIYNRWGEVVFTSDDKNRTWNGLLNNDGPACAEGTYFYVFDYRLIGTQDKRATGTVTLLR
ncbi:MAG: PKD domain-containing protein [Bacteroidia bacterium]